jgi:hypothetical protein
VVKVKDSESFTIKKPVINSLTLQLKKGNTVYSSAIFSTNNSRLSADRLLGVYRGTLTLPESALPLISGSPSPLTGVYINCVINNLPPLSTSLSGQSNTFNIYPVKGLYTIAKINEDIDLTQKFKDISLQSLFLDNKVLYDEFLGSIFGTIDSDQTTIGKLTYEKISNFISNNRTLDYSNINNLYSLFEELNIDTLKFSENNYRYPAELSRLIDILSINKTRLFGSVNAYNENFDTRGYHNSDVYGVNLGSEVSIFQTVTAGQGLVAYERFGNILKVISTYQPTSAVNSNSYVISAYNDNWGWGLVLPDTGYGEKIKDYYTFYNHIPTIEGSIKDSIINFEDTNTTITPSTSSYSNWSQQDGIIANLISNQLYKGLDLFD